MADPADDLDRLVAELDSGRVDAPVDASQLEAWLQLVAARGASDLLLVAGEPPTLRLHGRVTRTDAALLDGTEIEEMILPSLPAYAQRAYREHGIADASRRIVGTGRFRINLHHERGRPAATIRMLPARVPSLASLDLPAGVDLIGRLTRGLVIVGGATGSGKTTTMAAIVDQINRRDAKHIITIEDPIEYEHTSQKSLIQQVEIGIDAPDFPTALRSALRQAPDVIVIGEMRDPETMRIALAAGETGHLVMSTLHTTDIQATVARMTDSFPAERQPTIRQEIAAALAVVFVQLLAPRTGGGRVAAGELLVLGPGSRQHIRRNTLHQIHQEITMSRKQGSFTLEETLARLVKAGTLDRAEATLRANHVEEFEHML